MTIASVLIADALADIEVRSNNTTITDLEYSQGIRYLNRLMATWAEDGLNVGFHQVETKEDETNIPLYFEGCVVSHLGIMLAPSYGVPMDPRRLATADIMLDAVRNRLISLEPTNFGDNLPCGSGNYNGIYDNNFFQAEDPNNLKTGNNSQLDDDSSVDLSI